MGENPKGPFANKVFGDTAKITALESVGKDLMRCLGALSLVVSQKRCDNRKFSDKSLLDSNL